MEKEKILCEICARPNTQTRPFYCAVDARNQLYNGRLQNAMGLIQNEDLSRQVNTALSHEPATARRDHPSRPLAETLKSNQQVAADRTSQIIALADRLKASVDAVRQEVQGCGRRNARRRSDLASALNGLEARRSKILDEAERSIQLTRLKWDRNAETTAATRAFLCEEAARLYGLRQVKKGKWKRYEIGGVEIVELHAMNNMSPEVISTSLAHISHIVVLTSQYLAVRLPAEIILPHRDYPRPTIFSLPSSYRHGEVPFPGSHLASQLPMNGGSGDQQHLPRPRPLFIYKPLPTLAKEDPSAYALFLEGVTLLAYDIAWVCCAQGVSFGDKNSYEDICNMGQNLWQLLIGDRLHRKSVEPTFPASLTSPNGHYREDGLEDIARTKAQIGRWSHGTTHTFLGSADGAEFVRNFKLLNPVKLVDKLKRNLSSEAPMLEWEQIDGDEARAVEQEYDDGVLVKGHRRGSSNRKDSAIESLKTIRTADHPQDGTDSGAERSRAFGTSGWMKVKSR